MGFRLWRAAETVQLLDLAEQADRFTTSCVLSPPVLDDRVSVAAQAVAVATSYGLVEPPELADLVVDLLGADELLDKPTWHFSRGERQIAALVLAFARPFERLILIDPTAGLDPRRSRSLAHFLCELAQDFDVDVASESETFSRYW